MVALQDSAPFLSSLQSLMASFYPQNPLLMILDTGMLAIKPLHMLEEGIKAEGQKVA